MKLYPGFEFGSQISMTITSMLIAPHLLCSSKKYNETMYKLDFFYFLFSSLLRHWGNGMIWVKVMFLQNVSKIPCRLHTRTDFKLCLSLSLSLPLYLYFSHSFICLVWPSLTFSSLSRLYLRFQLPKVNKSTLSDFVDNCNEQDMA